VAHGGGDRPPYHAVLALGAWAEENYAVLDARCVLAGLDPVDLPPRRLLNLAYACIVEPLVLDPERRQEIDQKLDWPEFADRKATDREAAKEDASARMAAGAIGVGNVDRMLEAAWAERQRALAELEARKAAALTEGGS
jgi:hypothetical protein